MKKRLFMAFCSLFVVFSSVATGELRIISAEGLKKTMDTKKQVMVVDTRSEREFRQGHIPEAKNIPPEKISAISTFLPTNRNSLIIFYCRGAG